MKTTRVWMFSMLVALMLAGTGSHAAVVTGLYEASVPVPDQSASARRVALQQALAAVLVKVTGERTEGGVPALVKLAQDPSQFLQQYRYKQKPATGGAPALTYYDLTRTGAPAIPPTGLLLAAKFDPGLVDQAVRTAQEPLWGEERPATLVRLVIDDASGKNIVSSGSNAAVVQAMQSAARQRGAPLIFPDMDAQDQQATGVPDITQDNSAHIAAASRRYKPDATLAGNIVMTASGVYAARWQLTAGAKSASWSTPPGELASVAADGVQVMADNYAKWFAIAPGVNGVSGVSVSVAGIATVQAYAKVLAYLGRLTPVKSIQVARVEGQTVYFSLDTQGSVNNLQQAALLGGLLRNLAPAAVSGALPATAALQFQYVP